MRTSRLARAGGDEVLADAAGVDREAVGLPVGRVLRRVGVDGLVGTAVHGAVGLVVAGEVDRVERDRLRPDGRLGDRARRVPAAERLRPSDPRLEQSQGQVHRATVRHRARSPVLDTVRP